MLSASGSAVSFFSIRISSFLVVPSTVVVWVVWVVWVNTVARNKRSGDNMSILTRRHSFQPPEIVLYVIKYRKYFRRRCDRHTRRDRHRRTHCRWVAPYQTGSLFPTRAHVLLYEAPLPRQPRSVTGGIPENMGSNPGGGSFVVAPFLGRRCVCPYSMFGGVSHVLTRINAPGPLSVSVCACLSLSLCVCLCLPKQVGFLVVLRRRVFLSTNERRTNGPNLPYSYEIAHLEISRAPLACILVNT